MKIFSRSLQIGKVISFALLLAAWGAAGAGTNVFPQGREASEYQIKAAFLYNFAKFVEWPPEKSGEPDHPMKICIVGEDPFGSVLDESIKDKSINGRRLVIQRLKVGQNVKDCHVVYISSSEKSHIQTILEGFKGASVLTVGDMEGFAALGGVINFIMEGNRVRFEINVDAAERAHLKISSKLLSLARIVKE